MTRMMASSARAGIRADEVGRCRRRRERQRADHQHSDPGRRAEEHQHGEGELEAADELQAGQNDEMPVLQVALAPALVAADELDQRRRVLLPAEILLRQHAHLVAGAPHQRRLDLVVAQHMAAEHAVAGQRRDVAMRDERREPDRRVVAPIRAAVGLPPGAADGPGAHAEPHAELEDARERAGRRQADHQPLQDAELRIGLHDAHEAQDRGRGHEAVGVERDREFVLMPQRWQKSQKLPALKPVLTLRRR